MNPKQLILLVIVLAVLGAGAWFVSKKDQAVQTKSSVGMGEKLLPDFPINDVAEINIIQPTQELTVARSGEIWTVAERGGYPANFSTVSDVLRKFWELEVTKPVNVTAARLPALDLVPPDQGDGTKVVFKNGEGQTINSVLLGAQHMRESAGNASFGGGSFPDGRYVMVGEDVERVALVSDPLSSVAARPTDWLNKDFLKVQKIKSVTVTTGTETNDWRIERDTEGGSWSLANPKEGEELDSSKVSSANYLLSSPYFNDVLIDPKDEEIGLDAPRRAAIETFEGYNYQLQLGKMGEEDNYALRVDVSGDYPTEREPAEDEKEEDKAKLDKEFKDKLDTLQEKLKQEKALENWTYSMSKWSVDFLLKNRSELLKDPEEEAAADTATSAPENLPPDFDLDAFNPLNSLTPENP